MTDFVKAWQTGLEAANVAKLHQEDIDSVFNDLNTQLRQVIERDVEILVKPRVEKTIETQFLRDKVIVENRRSGEVTELALWEQGRYGFPCTITYGNRHASCEDKAALEKALAEMLRDPNIAQAIYNIQKDG